jgi:hypothetical protein
MRAFIFACIGAIANAVLGAFVLGSIQETAIRRFRLRLCDLVKGRKPMSAIGTKRTWACALQMSAIGGKADMPFCTAYVRL